MRTFYLSIAAFLWMSAAQGNDCGDNLPKLSRRDLFRTSIAAYLAANLPGPAAALSAGAGPESASIAALRFMKQILASMPAPRANNLSVQAWMEAIYGPRLRPQEEIKREPEDALEADGPAGRQVILPNAHLSATSMQFLEQLVRSGDVDWLAVEAIPASLQKTVDRYLKSAESTDEFKEADSTLQHLFSLEGEERQLDGKNHPLLRALNQAKNLQIPVHAVGLPASSHIAFHTLIPNSKRGLIATDQSNSQANPTRFLSRGSRQLVILIDE